MGWGVQIYFQLVAGINDHNFKMLTKINSYFGNIGNIFTDNTSNVYRLKFIGIFNSLTIKSHFDV